MSVVIPTISTTDDHWKGALGVATSASVNWRESGIPERYRDSVYQRWLDKLPKELLKLFPRKWNEQRAGYVQIGGYNELAKRAQKLQRYLTAHWVKAAMLSGYGHLYKGKDATSKNPIVEFSVQPIRDSFDFSRVTAELPQATWTVLDAVITGTAKGLGKGVAIVGRGLARGFKAGLKAGGIDPSKLPNVGDVGKWVKRFAIATGFAVALAAGAGVYLAVGKTK